jgi:uncharacterized protein YecE (DUF72 family)
MPDAGRRLTRLQPHARQHRPMAIRIGISGWRYAPWRGVFYPPELPQRAELEYASRRFDSIEINGSFYSLQTPASYTAWHDATPAEFEFAVKGPRYLTHILRLRNLEKPLANFLASGVLRLRGKLGPMLWQLPPTFRYDADVIEDFLAKLPRSSGQALAIARRRDVARMRGRSALAIDGDRPLRHAVEVRHESFCTASFLAQLRRHNVALVVADTAGKWPYTEDVTADFIYIRLHGDAELYVSGYGDAALDRWARRIAAWSSGTEMADAQRIAGPARRQAGRDVYCYFDNDAKVHAPFDALALMARIRALQARVKRKTAAKSAAASGGIRSRPTGSAATR